MNATAESIQATADKLGLTMTAAFVPWSQSRNKDEKTDRGAPVRSLNWEITICKGGRRILTTDYNAGVAFCPSYKQRGNIEDDRRVKTECESGSKYESGAMRGCQILPKLADVLHSLVLDSDALDYSTYEEWAAELGYDADSRKGEAVYRACLEIALKLRNGLGEQALAELRDAVSGY